MRTIYEFKESDVWDFHRFIGIPATQKGDELQFQHCPYCKGGSKSRKDKGTFAINLRTGSSSVCAPPAPHPGT